ncbi:MAG TPA: ATP-binding protein [Jatrophihabitans sp.]|nr:ATP-binding protein [Jatrophihabitans sp.]
MTTRRGGFVIEQMNREFIAEPLTPSVARVFAKTALPQLLGGPPPEGLSDDLELVVSELVTNAVLAGTPTVAVSLSLERTRVVVRVRDEASGWPQQRAATADDPGGRGLLLVAALSATWGVRLAETGKVVFAELAVPAA